MHYHYVFNSKSYYFRHYYYLSIYNNLISMHYHQAYILYSLYFVCIVYFVSSCAKPREQPSTRLENIGHHQSMLSAKCLQIRKYPMSINIEHHQFMLTSPTFGCKSTRFANMGHCQSVCQWNYSKCLRHSPDLPTLYQIIKSRPPKIKSKEKKSKTKIKFQFQF